MSEQSRPGPARRDRHRGARDDSRRGGGPRSRQGGYPRRREGEDRRGRAARGLDDDTRRGGGHGKTGHPGKGHSQRAGARRRHHRSSGPQDARYREHRNETLASGPAVSDDIDTRDLDPMVLQDLRVLSKSNADVVAKHLIMAATLMSEDPQLALRHARAAKERAGRVSVARETNGIAAYHAGEWKEALSELRAARRIGGGPGLLAVMADCERGLGRPAKAIEIATGEEAGKLDSAGRIELGIVLAGAHRDLGEPRRAVEVLAAVQPEADTPREPRARLAYALADAHLELGDAARAREGFRTARELDDEGTLDSEERLRELAGDGGHGA